jgi:CubicO group peptidase (beta-lactamase class C family)
MKKHFLYVCLPFLMISFFAQAQTSKTSRNNKDTVAIFDAYVQKAVKDWNIPGLAIMVVKNNEVVFKKTYGVKSLETNTPVTNETYFACASTTKAMTATAMGILVDQGKVSWDDPVIKYLPNFRLYEPYVTTQIRVRDLFLHNSGVGNTDYLWGMNILSGDEVIDRMQLVKPSYSFRSSFIYQNIFYHIAGKVIEKVSGETWADFVTAHIFKPLGMNRTVPLLSRIQDDNISQAHFTIDGKVKKITRDTADRVGAAGSVYSTIDDISLWVKCMIDSSKYAGGRLVSPATWKTLLKPQTFVTEDGFYPTAQLTKPNFTTYALGWFQQDYKGQKLNFHTGSLAGEIAIHGQMPALKTGVYVFANLDHAEARHALMFKAMDMFAVGGDTDWSTEFLKLYGDIKEKAKNAEKEQEAQRVLNTKPSLALDAYVGLYEDPLYGAINIANNNGVLQASNIKLGTGNLSHFNFDTFMIEWDQKWQGKTGVQFILNNVGKVSKVDFDGIELTKTK